MFPLVSPLLAAIVGRSVIKSEPCLVCGNALRADDSRIRVPGGGHVHYRCATYRMRQDARIRRRLGAAR